MPLRGLGPVLSVLGALGVLTLAAEARADDPLAGILPPIPSADADPSTGILRRENSGLHVESVHMQLASFVQNGRGYQSQAGPPGGQAAVLGQHAGRNRGRALVERA